MTDTGQGKNIEESRRLVNQRYELLAQIIETTPEEDWLGKLIETPFFWEGYAGTAFCSYSLS